LFNKDLEDSLKDFIPEYINYLAYKIEAKRELKESYDKLEGIIWQGVSGIFQSKSFENFENQYELEIKKINKEITLNPEKIDLYNSKIRILMYFDQFDEILELLTNMLEIFPENEKDIKIKKAYVLKSMQEVDAGLEIINELLQKYPKDNNILNYKAYWLQYLDKKEEAMELIQDIVNRAPDNGTYCDTYGEILMYFEEYEKAIKQFLKVLKIASTDWYINQTYIKLGICYQELKKYDLAVDYLEKGKDLTNKSLSDIDTKRKWVVIADLFLAEIEQLEAEF
ncbi:MAG: tetratricopeptide repeat protein, partial [Candidatus Hodarchaeota archaeon]